MKNLVVFALDDRLYSVQLSSVKRVYRVVEIMPLPKSPDIVMGAVCVQGEIIPVVNIRKRLRLPEREVKLSDQLVIVQTPLRVVAFMADSVKGVLEPFGQEAGEATKNLPGLEYVEGAVRLNGGFVFVLDLDRFLSLEEEARFSEAVEEKQRDEVG